MIQQAGVGLASREDANPYYENGYLSFIATPMSVLKSAMSYTGSKTLNEFIW